jgi:class 3 adenylate cyclase
MTATGLSRGSCGTELSENAKFCSQCGAAVSAGTTPAEYKQVTVLFADVVHSMDIAAAVGAERRRHQDGAGAERHASATTTLDIYGHLWPDADESTRTAIGKVIKGRVESAAYQLRTEGGRA